MFEIWVLVPTDNDTMEWTLHKVTDTAIEAVATLRHHQEMGYEAEMRFQTAAV